MRGLKQKNRGKCMFPKPVIRDILNIMKNKTFFFFLIATFLIMGASTLSASDPDIKTFSSQTGAILQLNKEKTMDSEEQPEDIGEQAETTEEPQLSEDSELPSREQILPETDELQTDSAPAAEEEKEHIVLQPAIKTKSGSKHFIVKAFASYPVFLDISSSDEANTRIKKTNGFSAGMESLYCVSFLQFGLSASYTANSVYDVNDYSSTDILLHAGMATTGRFGVRFDLFYGLDIIRYKSKSSMCQMLGAGIFAEFNISDVFMAELGGKVTFVPQEGKASYITQRIMPTAAIGIKL
jgi:hypothetical protein